MPGERTTWRAHASGPPDGPQPDSGGATEPFDPLAEEATQRIPSPPDEPARQAPAHPGEPAPLVLERYSLQRPLGAGAYGTVWLAHDERLARAVAVKAIPGVRDARARAGREALAAARLNHPGIVMLFEAGEENGVTYLVSELVDGFTLGQLFEDGQLSDRDVVRVGIALCDALAHAHANGVVHRDVKPSNVLVPLKRAAGACIVKLADFGVAQVAGGELLTNTGDVVGTLAYMAPEQAEGRTVGPPCDLYALALVLHEGLAGDNPVRAATPAATARRLGRPVPALASRRRGLPAVLCDAIDRAMVADPTARGSLGDLRKALNAALPLVDAEPGPVGTPRLERLWRSPPVPLTRLSRLAAGCAAGALCALALTRLGTVHGAAAPLAAGAGLLVALLPRAGWVAVAVALTAWQFGPAQHAGIALVLLLALLAPPLLLPRTGRAWSLPAFAPVLGLVGLAGAWPALAGLAGGPWRRAALGALGFWWLSLGELLLGRGLYLARPLGVHSPGSWESALSGTVDEALRPLVAAGRPLGALAWALAAVALPWLVRGPWPAAAAGALAWAVTLGAGMGALPGAPSGATVALGCAAGAVLALTLTLVRRAEPQPDAPDVPPPVA